MKFGEYSLVLCFATIVRVVYSIRFCPVLFFHWNSLEFVYFLFFFVRLSRDWVNFVENGRRINAWNKLRKYGNVDIVMTFKVKISNAKGDSKFRNISLKIPFSLIISWKCNCLDFASMFNRRISFVWWRQLCSSWCLIYRVFWKVCNYSHKDGEITLWYENYISTFSVSHIVSSFNYNLLNFLLIY